MWLVKLRFSIPELTTGRPSSSVVVTFCTAAVSNQNPALWALARRLLQCFHSSKALLCAVPMGSRALALTTPGPLCGHALCREGVLAHKAVYDGRRSLKLRQHPPSHLRQSRFSVSCGSSSFSADAKDFVEKAVSELSPETEG